MRAQRPRRKGATIWTQMLFIALVPSIAVVVVGAALSTYLVNQGLRASGFADDVRGALDPVTRLVVTTQEERRLTMLRRTGATGAGQPELERQRRRVDEATAGIRDMAGRLAGGATEDLRGSLDRLTEAGNGLPAARQQVDAGAVDPWHAYQAYNDLLDLCGAVIQGIARSAADAEAGFEQTISYDLFRSAEAMSRSHAMAERAVTVGLDGPQYREFAHQLGMYREQLESVVPRMTQPERDSYARLKQTPDWATVVTNDDSLVANSLTAARASFDVAAWQDAARKVGDGLMRLYVSHSRHAADLATERGRTTFLMSIIAGGVILVIAALSTVIALRVSRRLVTRLRGLREETLDLAKNGLPRMVAAISAGGGPVEVNGQVTRLDYGGDEVGQVADAFNTAQRTALTVAVREVETRRGVRSVFLNIARRSQAIVHRQLKVLDEAERSVEDPDQLRVLFELDHLATRGRRNAENLIILAGEQPGRQWRNPVPLRDIVRSAIAETEEYTRVDVSQIPEVWVIGTVVADIVHLIAELLDNGTAFAPQESRVDVRGDLVGRGVVVRVEDRGLGIEEARLAALNAMLHHPPDFDMMALSTESRVGLFVVARLAARHGIKVSLRDSDFGGTCAVVLIPASRIVQPGQEPAAAAPGRAASDHGNRAQQAFEPVRGDGNGAVQPNPPLPRRERQANLAPQLVSDQTVHTGQFEAPTERTVPAAETDDGEDRLRRSLRLRKNLTAFQQGTRQGRMSRPSSGEGE